MKKRSVCRAIFLLFGLFALQLACGTAALAKRGEFQFKWWQMPKVAASLNLSEKEKARLDALYLEHQKLMIDRDAVKDKEQVGLEAILNREPLDKKAATDQFARLLAAKNEKDTQRFEFLIEVRTLLGAERFQQLEGLVKQQWEKRHEEWREQKSEKTE